MNKYKIAIYTICKNEEANVEKWAASNSEADVRIVCDTGSTDGTVAKLKAAGIETYQITVDPWRFDVARNASLNLLPADVDICIWQDLDEVLLPGWREAIENNWQEGTTNANHRYRHNGGAWQWHYKIHARQNCRWRWPVHEKLAWSVPAHDIWIQDFYLDEHQIYKESRNSSYAGLIRKKIDEGECHWKTYMFLAVEYDRNGEPERARAEREIAYDVCDDGAIVKSYIARIIGMTYSDQGNHEQADLWFNRGVIDSPERETLYRWGHSFYVRKDWANAFVQLSRCVTQLARRDGYTYDPAAWSYLPYDELALCCYYLEMYSKAVDYGTQALEMDPNDVRLQNNLAFYKERVQ